ncbi:MAG: hydrogenase maturation protease [Anaerolineae bacterium]
MNTLVIGCGNLLRGDDAVGPILVRLMWEMGIPDTLTLADGGTGGMDVAFKMRGAQHVILVDACYSQSKPGTLFKIPGEELEELPPLQGINLHAFRWDHALAFARWLLKDEYPEKVTVYLIEAGQLEFGADLSVPVRKTMEQLAHQLIHEYSEPVIDDAG